MKAYITKFALTKGIVVAEGERDGKEGFVVRGAVPWDVHKFKLGEWHTDRDAALKRTNQMRFDKVDAAEREVARLRAMEFPIGDLV
jgi:hypothetical protein